MDPLVLGEVAAELLRQDRRLVEVRERHLAEAVKAASARIHAREVHSRVVPVPDWPRLGRSGVDVVVVDERTGRPRWVAELKWCQQGHDKVYEAIWDLFKVGLLVQSPGVLWGHLITGAPVDVWSNAMCRDLFVGGTFAPEELCTRRFPSGARRTAWDYLLEGGYGRHPDRVPSAIATAPVDEPVRVEDSSGAWLLRAVRVTIPVGATHVLFVGGWPEGMRPGDARQPAAG